MKKTIILILIGLLLVSVIAATTLRDRAELIQYFTDYKNTRIAAETVLGDSAVNTIKYLSDKECIINYDTENIKCYIQVNWTYDSRHFLNTIWVEEDTTDKEDEDRVRDIIRGKVSGKYKQENPTEEIKYIKSSVRGTTLNQAQI